MQEETEEEIEKRLTELVLERPLMSEACVRQEYNKRREWGEVGVVQVTQALSRMASAGLVELSKESWGSVSVRPSLALLRTVAPAPAELDGLELEVEKRQEDTVCRKMFEVQKLPSHFVEEKQFELVVTQVKNPEQIWFNIYEESDPKNPVYFDASEALMDKMGEFYSLGEGAKWTVRSVMECPAGTVLAALYRKEGWHRVQVKEVVNLHSLRLFYLDHGTTAVQKLKNVRFLKSEFSLLPAQALEARLWGVAELEGRSRWSTEARARLVELTQGEPGSLVAVIKYGVHKRNVKVVGRDRLLVDQGLTLRLVNVLQGPRGTDIGRALVEEGLVSWEDGQESWGEEQETLPLEEPTVVPVVEPPEDPLEEPESLERVERSLRRLLHLCRELGLGQEEQQLRAALGQDIH